MTNHPAKNTNRDSGTTSCSGALQSEERQRYRVHFSKRGNVCFTGHRDLIRTMERLFHRAELPITMSEGFHPKPRISYLSVLPLGFSSTDEVLDILLQVPIEEESLLARLNAVRVEGLDFLSVKRPSAKEERQRPIAFAYQFRVASSLKDDLAERIRRFLELTTCTVVKANGKSVDARPPVRSLTMDSEGLVTVDLAVQSGPEAGLREILLALGLEGELFRSFVPTRIRSIFE